MSIQPDHRSANQRALLAFVIVLALLVSATSLAVSSLQGKYLRNEARAQFQTELALLGELAVEPLLRNDYAAVEGLVQTWVKRSVNPLQITAVTPNGFVLVAAQNGKPISHAIEAEQSVVLGERKLLVLHAVADVSSLEDSISSIQHSASLIAAALVLLLGWALWSVLQRTAIRPLEAEIQDRMQQERELQRRTVELETAIKELDAFSYSVSHDLRAPLRAIDGYCHILSQDYATALDATAQQYLVRTRSAAQRMGLLIDDLLGLARMTQHELSLADMDLSALAHESIGRLSQSEPERQVAISVAEGVIARADPALVGIIFDNLLGNAWKYTAQTPGAAIEFGRQEHNGETVFFVRDNGVGFDMQFVHKLFQPFQRLHGADFPGNGIGLAMVQRIIQRHGGTVWAEGQPGKGATFYFTLGARPAQS